MTNLLELQADRIEGVLTDFGIEARIFGGQLLPRVVNFLVQLGPGHRLREVEGLHEEIALALQVPSVIVRRDDNNLTVQVPRGEGQTLRFGQIADKLEGVPPPHTMLLGLGGGGTPLLLYMPSPLVAHVLIAGMTGCGKTELLRTMLVSLSMWTARRQAGVYLIDPKGRKLARMAGLPDVLQSASLENAPSVVEHLLATMERRDAGGFNTPRLYLVIDELADLVLVHGRPIEIALTRLVQRGREAGIHVVATTQRPSSGVVQGLMKANFPIRISGAVNSAREASITTGVPKSGAERLLGKGDMLLAHHGQLMRFQVCITSPADIPSEQGAVVQDSGGDKKVMQRLSERLKPHRPGRPRKAPSKEMVDFAAKRIEAAGECSQRELRRWHKESYGTDVHPPRAVAAITEAKRLLGLRFG